MPLSYMGSKSEKRVGEDQSEDGGAYKKEIGIMIEKA